MTVLVANTNIIELIGLKSAVDDTYINTATVTATIFDYHSDRAVGNQLTLDYVVASDGVYRAMLAETLPFRPNADYIAYIEATAGAGRVGHWEIIFRPTVRRS